ncbi:Uncharacterised protein [Mycobacteroides abscessus subsp. abscessus]|nr:Uncharacterised protein [Mycobacteroides abscessus subsp. abscessus]
MIRVGHEFHRDREHEVVVGLHLLAVAFVAQPQATEICILVEADNVVPLVAQLLDRRQATRSRTNHTHLHGNSFEYSGAGIGNRSTII